MVANGCPRAGLSADKRAAECHKSGKSVARDDTAYAADCRDVDGIAIHGATQYGKAQATCNWSSSDERAAARLPSGNSSLDCVEITSGAGDAAKSRYADGIHCPRAPQLGGVRPDKTYGSLVALKRWVHRLERGQDKT